MREGGRERERELAAVPVVSTDRCGDDIDRQESSLVSLQEAQCSFTAPSPPFLW